MEGKLGYCARPDLVMVRDGEDGSSWVKLLVADTASLVGDVALTVAELM